MESRDKPFDTTQEEPLCMTNVIHLRLVNGDEIIGDWIGIDDQNQFRIKHPMAVSENIAQGVSQVVLSRYIMFMDWEILPIKPEHIMTYSPVIPEMEAYYQNSVVYNQKVVMNNVMDELKKVNGVMESMLYNKTKADEVALRADAHEPKFIHIPESNTYH
jgi:hypothetical protein